MRMMTLSSGSSGNCIYIGTEKRNILIDDGIPLKRVEAGLSEAGLSVNDLDAVFVTHEHADHVGGLGVLLRKYAVPVYLTEGTFEALMCDRSLGSLPQEAFNIIKSNSVFDFGDLKVHAIGTCHDAAAPVVYRFDCGEKSLAIVTDTGRVSDSLIEHLQALDAVLLEANHDVRMLQAGPYPYALKRRISGNNGHLSNEDAGRLAAALCSEKMKCIVLGHLSKTNNYDELAKEAVRVELEFNMSDIPEIYVAPRCCASKIIEI